MENSEKYDLIADRYVPTPSNMGIVPLSSHQRINAEYIREALANNDIFSLVSFAEEDDNTFLLTICHEDEDIPVEIYINPMSRINIQEFGFANQVSDEEFKTALNQDYFVELSIFFGEKILDFFHLQLKILNILIPNACIVIDFMSYRLLSAQWLRMTVASPIPPSPSYLYTIHGVYDEKNGLKSYWLHTHGLNRCGSVEFEILNIHEGAQQMNDLIIHLVKRILKNPPKEYEKFQIGYDGMDINLTWLRWEEALQYFPDHILGGIQDRSGDNNAHDAPSGILFAVEDGNLISPEIYAKALSENPIYYISNEETSRMSQLAKERFFCFKDAFKKYGEKKTVSELRSNFNNKEFSGNAPWQFLVKLGLSVDKAKAKTEREHLWFNVINIEGEYVEAELLNQPYWISSLNEGDINKYPIKFLTDWIVYSPDNTYTTDSIYELGYFR